MTAKTENKLIAVIQARMGSTRLPGKCLMPLAGRPVLEHIWRRLRSVSLISQTIVATTQKRSDDVIADTCREKDVPCFRGSEQDVLDRFYQAAKAYGAETVLRVTADCPLIDPKLLEALIRRYQKSRPDYCGIGTGAGMERFPDTPRYPDGTDAEIFSFEALRQVWEKAKRREQREHVTPYFWQHPDRFKLDRLTSPTDYRYLRLTLDRKEDYELIRWVYEQCYTANALFGLKEVLALYRREPLKFNGNRRWAGREGYEALRR